MSSRHEVYDSSFETKSFHPFFLMGRTAISWSTESVLTLSSPSDTRNECDLAVWIQSSEVRLQSVSLLMDKYVITIIEEDLSPILNDLGSSRNNEIEISSPYVEWLLQTRKSENYSISLRLSLQNGENSSKTTCYDWQRDEDADKTVHDVTYKKAAEVLLLLAEELPVPGSYIMDIIWVTRNLGQSEILQKVSPILGALKKLCVWHLGQLHVFIDGEIEKRTRSTIDFVTRHAKILPYIKEKIILPFKDGVVWRGSLDILSKGVTTHSLPRFSMTLDTTKVQPQITVRFAQETDTKTETVCSRNTGSVEQVWFGPRLSLLQFIDISTVPLYLFSGKRFVLWYTCEEKTTEDWDFVKYLQEVLGSDTSGAFLCSMDYAISNIGFDNIPEYSTKNWQQAVLKTPHNLMAPKYRFHIRTRLLHLILCQSNEDKSFVEWNGHNIIQFTAIILHPLEDINATPLSHAEMRKSFYSMAVEDCSYTTLESVENLPEINVSGLIYKEQRFNRFLCVGLKQWSDSHNTTMIPYSELKNLVLNTSQHLNHAQEMTLFSSANNTDDTLVNSIRPPNDIILNCEKLHDLQLQALRNRDSFLQDPESKLRKIKSADSLRAVTKANIDMHFDVVDILNCFGSNQDSTESLDTLAAWRTKPSFLSPRKLTDFGEAIKLSHCGVMYNIDDRLAEKQDRMCRRMVEKLVKFETTSLGSSEKVPSPATMNIADSPIKRSSLCAGSSKRKQLKKVAEKLYKKRIQSREARSSSASRPTTSMVLRSTPTKSKNNLLRRNSTICLRSSTSENCDIRLLKDRTQSDSLPKKNLQDEERISKRRSHVQDNKKRLQELVTHALSENGIHKTDKKFNSCAKRLYNVSIAFLRDLKTSKNLEKIMKQTVLENVHSVISFKEK